MNLHIVPEKATFGTFEPADHFYLLSFFTSWLPNLMDLFSL